MSGPFMLSTAMFDLIFDEDSSYYMSAFIPYILGSYDLVYDNLYDDYSEYYDSPYDATFETFLSAGTYTFNQWAAATPRRYFNFMVDSVLTEMIENPNHPARLDLKANDVHNWAPQKPVTMIYCGLDSMVTPLNSILTYDSMAARGATQVSALEINSNGTHETCFTPAMKYALEWFNSLRSSCGIINVGLDNPKETEINLFPNPVGNFAEFNSLEISSFKVFDLIGRQILQGSGQRIGFEEINPGVYFVSGFDSDGKLIYSKRLIKE